VESLYVERELESVKPQFRTEEAIADLKKEARSEYKDSDATELRGALSLLLRQNTRGSKQSSGNVGARK
jgi:hypothetical protein